MDISNEMAIKEYIMREEGGIRAPYSSEFEFYILVNGHEVCVRRFKCDRILLDFHRAPLT